MEIKYDKDPIAAEQNSYSREIVNVYIVHRSDAWPRNPSNNFKPFKDCLSGAISPVKNSDK